jgi:hypothetical protein
LSREINLTPQSSHVSKTLESMVLVTMRPRPTRSLGAAKFDKPAVKIMFQVTQIVRFLL